MLVIALVIIIFLVIFRLTKFLMYYKYEWYRRYMTIQDMIFYNLFIRYILQSSLKLQIAAGTTLMVLDGFSELKDIVQGVSSILLLVLLSFCPIVFVVVLYKNYLNLAWLSIEKKFGSMYMGVYLETMDIYPLTYSIIFQLRRIIFVFLTFFLYNYVGIQLQVFIYTNVLYIIYLNFNRIYYEYFTLFLENLNEVFFLITLYHLVLFGNMVHDPYMIEYIGVSMVCSVGIILATGTFVIVFINVKAIMRALKLRKLKKIRKAILNKRDE